MVRGPAFAILPDGRVRMAKEIWGPPLWRLLHSLAERLGKQTISILATDEKRAWIQCLRAVGTSMPCIACRTHFQEWCAKRPLEKFTHSYQFQQDAREWLWSLHEEVNRERGNSGPSLSEIPELYGHRTVQELNVDYKSVCDAFREAVSRGQLNSDAFMNFKLQIVKLRALTG